MNCQLKKLPSYLRVLSAIAFSSVTFCSFACAEPSSLTGIDAATLKPVTAAAESQKPLVVVFISSVCPCSNSHMGELKALKNDFPSANFVGVHANADEHNEAAVKYFKESALPFPVIEDREGKIVEQFKALKTPHAFIVDEKGQLLYRGGVSNSVDFASAREKYLRNALEDLSQNKKVRKNETRTLGCVIARGK